MRIPHLMVFIALSLVTSFLLFVAGAVAAGTVMMIVTSILALIMTIMFLML